jgi:predicted GTPase
MESCTKKTQAKISNIKMCGDDRKFAGHNLLKIVDTPGLQDSENKDTEHVKDMVDTIKGLKYVNQF